MDYIFTEVILFGTSYIGFICVKFSGIDWRLNGFETIHPDTWTDYRRGLSYYWLINVSIIHQSNRCSQMWPHQNVPHRVVRHSLHTLVESTVSLDTCKTCVSYSESGQDHFLTLVFSHGWALCLDLVFCTS